MARPPRCAGSDTTQSVERHPVPVTRPVPADPDRLDSREVYEAGELEGYALVEVGWGRAPLTPTRCCRTCAWADAKHVVHVAGVGLAYRPPATP